MNKKLYGNIKNNESGLDKDLLDEYYENLVNMGN